MCKQGEFILTLQSSKLGDNHHLSNKTVFFAEPADSLLEEINDQSQEIVYETTLEENEQQVETMDGSSRIISITKKEPVDDQDPEEGIKFAVKTRGNENEAPVEFEVELKDQKLIASGQLEDQTQTVMNLLSEGNVVDAILQNLAGVAQEEAMAKELEAQEQELLMSEKLETRKRW